MAFGGGGYGGFSVGASSAASGRDSSVHSDVSQVYHSAGGGDGKLPVLQMGSPVLGTAAAMAAVARATTSPRMLHSSPYGEVGVRSGPDLFGHQVHHAPSFISSLPSREQSHTLHSSREQSFPMGIADMAAGPCSARTAHKPFPACVGGYNRETQSVVVAQAQVQAAVAALLQEQPHLISPQKKVSEMGSMTGASLLVEPGDALIPEPVLTDMRYPMAPTSDPMAPTSEDAAQHGTSGFKRAVETSAPSFYYPVNSHPLPAHPLPLMTYRSSSRAMPLIFENKVHCSGSSGSMVSVAAVPPPAPRKEVKGEVGLTSATRKKEKKRRQEASTCEECFCCG